MPRPAAIALLLLCTMFWGFAFVVQKTAMESMGPLTFIGVRYLLGGLVLLPIALMERRRQSVHLHRGQWLFTALLALAFFLGSWLQQAGLLTTTVTNGGFLTSLYVLFVPVIALILLRTWPHPIVWVGMPMALIGIYYLNGGGLDQLNGGDALIISSAIFWATHVLMLGHIARTTGQPILISCITFLAAGAAGLALAFVLETPSMSGIMGGWMELAYAGIFSTAIAFTFQAVGQQYVPAANAAIILSSESLFAALGGAVLLGERLPLIGYAGAALILFAILLVEIVPALHARKTAPAQ